MNLRSVFPTRRICNASLAFIGKVLTAELPGHLYRQMSWARHMLGLERPLPPILIRHLEKNIHSSPVSLAP